MAYKSGDVTNAAVLEVGRHTAKLGYAGEDSPRAFFQTTVAVPRSESEDGDDDHPQHEQNHTTTNNSNESNNNKSEKQLKGGNHKNNNKDVKKLKMRFEPLNDTIDPKNDDLYQLKHAVDEDGLVQDWDLWLKTVRHAYGRFTNNINKMDDDDDEDDDDMLSDAPLIMVEKPHNTPQIREKTVEMMFESTHVPAVFLAKDAVLSCYACGRTTGIVADVGDCTLVSPVYEGWVEGKGLLRGVGVQCIQDKLIQVLDDMKFQKKTYFANRNTEFQQLAMTQLATRCLEHLSPYSVAEYGYVAHNFKHIPKLPYHLPDGTEVQFGNERFEFGELLLGDDHKNKIREEYGANFGTRTKSSVEFFSGAVQNMICESAFRCDREQQAQLLGNVVIAGGGACVEGIVDRVRAEVEAIIHTHTPGWRVKVLSPPITERAYCAWLGGSILGSLGSFSEMYISRQEYQEYGSNIVHRKCP